MKRSNWEKKKNKEKNKPNKQNPKWSNVNEWLFHLNNSTNKWLTSASSTAQCYSHAESLELLELTLFLRPESTWNWATARRERKETPKKVKQWVTLLFKQQHKQVVNLSNKNITWRSCKLPAEWTCQSNSAEMLLINPFTATMSPENKQYPLGNLKSIRIFFFFFAWHGKDFHQNS